MRSIGARLAFLYALSSTAALAVFFGAGRYFLEQHAIHTLDLLNETQFEQLRAELGPGYSTLSTSEVRDRVAASMEHASVLFYVEIHQKGGKNLYRSSNLHGQPIPDVPGKRVFNAPVPGLGELRAGEFSLGPLDITIATSKRQVREVMQGYQKNFVELLIAMLVVSSIIGYALSRIALKPVSAISETAARIRSDNLGARIPVGDVRDEISDLARLLNEMFDRLEASFNQTRRFAAEASHELKTPLSLVRLHAEKLLLDGQLKPGQEEALQQQLEEIARLNTIIEELLFLSRAEAKAIPLDTKPQDPRRFLESFAADATVLAEVRGVRFELKVDATSPVGFDPRWIRQVLLNLVANALNVAPRGTAISLRSTQTETCWQVAVTDEGPGVAPEQRARIFERFVRLKQDDGGSGLGLAICQSIVQLHGGTIRAEGREPTGLSVIFEIPVAPVAEPVSA